MTMPKGWRDRIDAQNERSIREKEIAGANVHNPPKRFEEKEEVKQQERSEPLSVTVVDVRKTKSYDVYIGRENKTYGLPWSKWANPFVEGKHGTREEVIKMYISWLLTGKPEPDREYISKNKEYVPPEILRTQISEIKGKTVACWCAPDPCHGYFLADFADLH